MNWVKEVMRRVWDTIKYDNSSYDPYNTRQARTIGTFATKYFQPFHTKESEKRKRDGHFNSDANERGGRARLGESR